MLFPTDRAFRRSSRDSLGISPADDNVAAAVGCADIDLIDSNRGRGLCIDRHLGFEALSVAICGGDDIIVVTKNRLGITDNYSSAGRYAVGQCGDGHRRTAAVETQIGQRFDCPSFCVGRRSFHPDIDGAVGHSGRHDRGSGGNCRGAVICHTDIVESAMVGAGADEVESYAAVPFFSCEETMIVDIFFRMLIDNAHDLAFLSGHGREVADMCTESELEEIAVA